MLRSDAREGYFATAYKDSANYTLTISATTAYLDVPPGEYDCWMPAGVAGEHVRWAYLAWPTPASPPTILAASFPAPTPATAGAGGPPVRLTSGVPGAAQGVGWAPADSGIVRIAVPPDTRVAVLYSAAGPISMHAIKVL